MVDGDADPSGELLSVYLSQGGNGAEDEAIIFLKLEFEVST